MSGKRIPLLLLPLFIAACSNSECYDNHSALPLAGFYSAENGAAINVGPISIRGLGAPGDSILYFDETLHQAYLPFRLSSDNTVYVIDYPDENLLTDTISFSYERKPWFVNPACGAMYFFEMRDVRYTTHSIDSVGTDETITNLNTENIRIYFKTVSQ